MVRKVRVLQYKDRRVRKDLLVCLARMLDIKDRVRRYKDRRVRKDLLVV